MIIEDTEVRCVDCGVRTSRLEADLRCFHRKRCARCKGLLLPSSVTPTQLVGATRAASIARVHPNTIRNWSTSGRLPVAWTLPSGYKRYRAIDVARAAIYPWAFAFASAAIT